MFFVVVRQRSIPLREAGGTAAYSGTLEVCLCQAGSHEDHSPP